MKTIISICLNIVLLLIIIFIYVGHLIFDPYYKGYVGMVLNKVASEIEAGNSKRVQKVLSEVRYRPSYNELASTLMKLSNTETAEHDAPAPSNSLTLEVQRDSMIDFHRFLEAIKLLVSQRRSSVNVTIGPDNKILEFISEDCVPGDPLLIRVSPDQVAIGSGLLYQPLTMDQLKKHLKESAHAASMSNAKGIVLLYSDRQVSGEFGLVILNAIVDSGISAITLGSPVLPEPPISVPPQKPSSPASR